MKKFAIFFFLTSCAHRMAAPSSPPLAVPPIPVAAQSESDHVFPRGTIPLDYKLEHDSIWEDINGDGELDLISTVSGGGGHPPALAIEVTKGGKRELYMLNEDLFRCSPEYDAKKKVLTLKSGQTGAHDSEFYLAKFRFQEGEFFLIGSRVDQSGHNQACGEHACWTYSTEINYLTGQVKESSFDLSENKRTHKNSKIPKAPLIRLKDFRFDLLIPKDEEQ